MPTESDRQFVMIAITKGFFEAEQGRELLIRLGQAEKNNAHLSVERLVVMEELLQEDQVEKIREAMHRKLLYCVCGQKMNIFQFKPGTKVKCTHCERVVEVPE